MKFLLLTFFLGAAAAASVPGKAEDYPTRFAYLVLPPQNSSSNASSTTPAPPAADQNDKDSLDSVNASIMERLRQEVGSEGGVYHVYLSDGRLQRVQYTAAPVSQQQNQQPEAPRSEKQVASSQEQSGEAVQGFYYVQVPEQRLQALSAYPSAEYRQQSQPAQVQESSGAAYSQNAAAEVNAQYFQVKLVTPEQLSQIRSAVASSGQPAPSSGSVPSDQGEAERNLGQQFYSSDRFRAQAAPAPAADEQADRPAQPQEGAYVASARYSEVQPISGPVYAYSPQQLTRILRYAQL